MLRRIIPVLCTILGITLASWAVLSAQSVAKGPTHNTIITTADAGSYVREGDQATISFFGNVRMARDNGQEVLVCQKLTAEIKKDEVNTVAAPDAKYSKYFITIEENGKPIRYVVECRGYIESNLKRARLLPSTAGRPFVQIAPVDHADNQYVKITANEIVYNLTRTDLNTPSATLVHATGDVQITGKRKRDGIDEEIHGVSPVVQYLLEHNAVSGADKGEFTHVIRFDKATGSNGRPKLTIPQYRMNDVGTQRLHDGKLTADTIAYFPNALSLAQERCRETDADRRPILAMKASGSVQFSAIVHSPAVKQAKAKSDPFSGLPEQQGWQIEAGQLFMQFEKNHDPACGFDQVIRLNRGSDRFQVVMYDAKTQDVVIDTNSDPAYINMTTMDFASGRLAAESVKGGNQ